MTLNSYPKSSSDPVKAVDYYDRFAPEYDRLASEYHWLSPKIMFGMLNDYAIRGHKLLDVGIGTGLSSLPFYKSGMIIYGIDGSQKMLNICANKGIAEELILRDLETESLPHANEQFDMVISNGVCYFISNIDNYLSECIRVLKPGGIFSFNFEHITDGLMAEFQDKTSYLNYSNCAISKRLKEKTGVTVFKHNKDFIMQKVSRLDIKVHEVIVYYAYTSPTTQEDVYFTLLVMEKTKPK